MRNKVFILLLLMVFSCQTKEKNQNKSSKTELDAIFENKFEHSLISRGDNFPDFDFTKDSMDLFLVSTHQNIPLSEFEDKTKFSKNKIAQIVSLLESKNWLYIENGEPKPSVFIATEKEGNKLFEYSIPIANEIVASIENELPRIKKQFEQTNISKKQDFKDWSFLILSNVLLDSWQIDNVEQEFLKKDQRPKRHGKNYYFSVMENNKNNKEAFGIYGNQYDEKDGKSVSIYGNNRIGVKSSSIANLISKSDNLILNNIATIFKPKLINILNQYSEYSMKVYKETGYDKEITFDEFFIWWYHFIYTKATDIMNEKQMLEVPKSGNFEYILEE